MLAAILSSGLSPVKLNRDGPQPVEDGQYTKSISSPWQLQRGCVEETSQHQAFPSIEQTFFLKFESGAHLKQSSALVIFIGLPIVEGLNEIFPFERSSKI